MVQLISNNLNLGLVSQRSKLLTADASKASISRVCVPRDMNNTYYLQSEDIDETSESSGENHGVSTKEQNVRFNDAYIGNTYDTPLGDNPIALVDGSEDIRLGQFLSRPTKVGVFSWNQSTNPGTIATLNVWKLFFNNAQIRKKVDNFAFVRCRLHVKFVVNASPFLYGFGFVTYKPLVATGWVPVRTNSVDNSFQQIQLYQQPHVDIIPGKSAGGEMSLPMFYKGNWLPLTDAALTEVGTIQFHTSTLLLGATGQTGMSADIQVYAWATDVMLSGPTSTLAVQSSDEYGDGPISRPASTIAKFASNFTSAPIVGPFAKATEIGASAVSAIASLFGYSNPPNIDNVSYMQNTNMPHLASSAISVGMQKLSLDPKCELSIDGRPHDLPSDDSLNIANLCSRESLLGAAIWSAGDPVDNEIFHARVTPMLCKLVTENGCNRVYTTPMAHIGHLFQYWRGDIIFRFKFIVSKFHKGRVRVSYDPFGDITSNPDTFNTVFTEVLDIGEDNDVEIVIPYTQWSTWKKVRDLSQNYSFRHLDGLTPNPLFDNGMLSVRILTELSAPSIGAVANMLVFVRAGDNFEFNVPFDRNAYGTKMITPLAVQSEDSLNLGPRIVRFGSTSTHEKIGTLNMGENIRSLRQVLQRDHLSERIPIASQSAATYAKYCQYFTRLPLLQGYDNVNNITLGNKIAAGTGTAGVNYVNFSPLHHVLMMFVAFRGGINNQFNLSTTDYGPIDNFTVARFGKGIAPNFRFGTTTSVLSSLTPTIAAKWSILNVTAANCGLGGAAISSQRNNNSLSVVMPDYNYYNFRIYNPLATILGENSTGSDEDTYMWEMVFTPTDAAKQATGALFVDRWVSVGVDFMPLFFLCTPTLDIYNSIPTAV